jgi:hypothetical protein
MTIFNTQMIYLIALLDYSVIAGKNSNAAKNLSKILDFSKGLITY